MSRKIHNPALIANARALRKNQTDEERHLWYEFLCQLPIRFTRQKIIGNYIVDFCCSSKKIILELDGAQHYEEKGERKDSIRDSVLESMGYTVLRYSDKEVNANFKGVCEDIWNHLFSEEK